jgi:hypothetical protein
MTSPRGDYHANRARKLAVLVDRLRVPADRLLLTEACRGHWHRRAELPRRRLERISPIVRESQSGISQRFSSGLRSALRDLFEPLP